MSEEPKLLNCPFCGKQPTWRSKLTFNDRADYTWCCKCYETGMTAERWNTRPESSGNSFAEFGRMVYEFIVDWDGWFGEELSVTLMPMAEKAGLATRAQYDPDEHGEGIEADPGDEIWLWTPVEELSGNSGEVKREQQQTARIAELEQRRSKLQEFIPQTFGDAVQAKWLKLGEIDGHEWDNRTSEENAMWMIEVLRKCLAQQAESHAAEIERLNGEIRELTDANRRLTATKGATE